MIMHCTECRSLEDYEWDLYGNWRWAVSGAVMVCKEHGLLAHGWVYDEDLGRQGWKPNRQRVGGA
jgi:hypothetical protein